MNTRNFFLLLIFIIVTLGTIIFYTNQNNIKHDSTTEEVLTLESSSVGSTYGEFTLVAVDESPMGNGNLINKYVFSGKKTMEGFIEIVPPGYDSGYTVFFTPSSKHTKELPFYSNRPEKRYFLGHLEELSEFDSSLTENSTESKYVVTVNEIHYLTSEYGFGGYPNRMRVTSITSL